MHIVHRRADDAPPPPVHARPERLDRLPVARPARVGSACASGRRERRRGRDLNPTIFEKALSAGSAYDAQIAAVEGDAKRVFVRLASADVAAACDVLHPVWERTRGCDVYVSIEVDPNLADDADATIAEAAVLHESLDRPNLLVKIPATDTGVSAIEYKI